MIEEKAFLKKKSVTPSMAVRSYCIACVQSSREVEFCKGYFLPAIGKACPLFSYRLGEGKVSVKVIRAECLCCCGGSPKLVASCQTTNCNLYPFRMGKNPNYRVTEAKSQALTQSRNKKDKISIKKPAGPIQLKLPFDLLR